MFSLSKLSVSMLIASLCASFIYVTIILPAEFNRDPLGTGALLGIVGLSRTQIDFHRSDTFVLNQDTRQLTLLPFESFELKFQLKQNAALIYEWQASGPLYSDFHSEAEGGPKGVAESFHIGQFERQSASFIAPFNGVHGWFFENRTATTIDLTINAAGFYQNTLLYRDGEIERLP